MNEKYATEGCAPQQDSAIDAALSSLEKEQADLGANLEKLELKLQPVCTPQPPVGNAKDGPQVVPAQSRLTDTIRHAEITTRRQNAIVLAILKSLEI